MKLSFSPRCDRMTHLVPHRIRVHLAHVTSGVVELDVRDVQLPGVVPVVRDREPRIHGHHVGVDGQDGLRVGLDPGDLGGEEMKKSLKDMNEIVISIGEV